MQSLGGDEDEDQNYDDNEADLIPGDNSLPSSESQPSNPDAPINLTQIPDVDLPSSKDLGGDGESAAD